MKKLLESRWVLLLAFLDVLYNWGDRIIKATQTKQPIITMFSQINLTETYDTLIRIVIAFLVWKLYKDFQHYKRISDEKMTRLNNKIHALDKIHHNAEDVLRDLYIDMRDTSSENTHNVIEIFKRMGVTGIGINEEHENIKKYKDKVNKKLDEEESHLEKILSNDEGFENI
jgi:hypothetical protein